jgi:replicative superfamily II helicase
MSKKSFLLGGALGWFSAKLLGKKEVRDELREYTTDLQRQIAKEIHALERITKDEYERLVDRVSALYNDAHDLADEHKHEAIAGLKARWEIVRQTFTKYHDEDKA